MTPDETSLSYRGWRVVILCFVLAIFAWGFAFYGHSIYLAELLHRYGWTSFTVSAASTVSYLFSALLVVFVGEAVARLGPRRFLLGGVACLGVSMVLVGQVREPWQLYAVYLLMAVGWSAMSVVAITTLIAQWFEKKRGLAISLAFNGASFGGIVGAPALLAAVERLGFETALWAGAVLMLVILVPMILAWGDRPPEAEEERLRSGVRQQGVGEERSDRPWTRARALRSVPFWTITAPFALALLAQVGFLVHLIAMLEPGIGRATAGLAISIITFAAVIGRVGLGFVIDRLDRRMVSAVSLASQVAALLVIQASDDAVVILSACALFGLSVGNVITLPALVIQQEFDARAFPTLIGLSTAICQVAYAFGPGLLGLLRDATGGYSTPILVCAAADATAAAIVLIRGASARQTEKA